MPNPTPGTIEELKAWYVAHNLPPEEITRFFIGKDVREARAFGIYRDGDRYVVYKNKDDGSRAVRYQGPDEGYAVNELYLRLKQEIDNQKANQPGKHEEKKLTPQERLAQRIAIAVVALVSAVILFFTVRSIIMEPDRGYYYYDDSWFYYNLSSESWYRYGDEWTPVTADKELHDNWKDYYVNRELTRDMGVTDIKLTEYYSTKDSGSSWSSSDSWDSGYTDWSSDW